MNTQEFQQFVINQFTKVAVKEDLANLATKDEITDLATKDDISNIYLNMATKSELAEVKAIVTRLDRRTDEDIRATIKDVENIKGVLRNQGHHI